MLYSYTATSTKLNIEIPPHYAILMIEFGPSQYYCWPAFGTRDVYRVHNSTMPICIVRVLSMKAARALCTKALPCCIDPSPMYQLPYFSLVAKLHLGQKKGRTLSCSLVEHTTRIHSREVPTKSNHREDLQYVEQC